MLSAAQALPAPRLVVEEDRRSSIRLAPPADDPVPVHLATLDGEIVGPERPCVNVGLGGFRLRLERAEGRLLGQGQRVHCAFRLRGGGQHTLPAEVAYLHQRGRSCFAGIRLLPCPELCAATAELYGYLARHDALWA